MYTVDNKFEVGEECYTVCRITIKYDAFLRTMFAVHSIENNKFLKLKNRPVDEIVYDITYEGKTLSSCHEIRMMNESYKINF